MTAFQIDAFQNNAFQILIPFEVVIALGLTITADLRDFSALDAALTAGGVTITAGLIDFSKLATHVALGMTLTADMTAIEQLSATLSMGIGVSVAEGFLRSEQTIFAPAVNPSSVQLRR